MDVFHIQFHLLLEGDLRTARYLPDTGDAGDDLEPAARYGLYQTDYWGKPKRCALWEIDPSALTARFVLDLPSRGDTCFASVVPRGDDAYALFNYSSPLNVPPDAPDLSWLQGQTGRTLVYRQRLVLPSGR